MPVGIFIDRALGYARAPKRAPMREAPSQSPMQLWESAQYYRTSVTNLYPSLRPYLRFLPRAPFGHLPGQLTT